MSTAKKEIDFSKETDDVLVLLVGLVKDIKEKKGVSELVSNNLPKLMSAIGDADQIPEEQKDRKVLLQTIGYRTGELADALLGSKSE